MLKVITKQGNNWIDSGILIDLSSPDIKNTIYKNSNEQLDFIPPLVYVVKVKETEVFIESILNVLRPLVKFLKDTRYVEGLYNDVSKYFSDLSKDQFNNCVELVIKESTNKDTEESIITIIEQYEEEFPPEFVSREEEEEEGEEEGEDQEEPTISILRFKTSFGKVIESPNLQELYDTLILNKEFMISKTLYGNEPEYIKTGLTSDQEKAINEFVYSEHSSIKKEKILVKGVVNLLYYDLKYTILVKIADTGFVSLKIEPKKLLITSVDKTIQDLTKKIQKIYKELVKKEIEDVEFNSFEIKIQYPKRLGYYTKELVSNIEKSEIKNGKVQYPISDFTTWFSSKDEKLNFTIKGVKDIESIEKVKESVEKRVNYYLNNMGSFSTKQNEGSTEVSISTQVPHGLKNAKKVRIFNSSSDGIFDITSASRTRILFDPKKKLSTGNFIFMGNVKKTSLKNLRLAGLVVNSKECQKARRPELLLKGDPSTGDDILELNGRKFRCNSPYTYHGVINNVNCCYKKKVQDSVVKQKKAPVKRFDKAVKGYKKTLEGSLSHYLEDNYFLYTVQDLNENRTIMECLEYLFDNTIDFILGNIEENVFLQNFKDVDFNTWKNTEEKSIYDIIKVVSLYTRTSIFIFLDNLSSGLQVECLDIPYYEKYAIIYRSTEKTPAFYPVIKENVKIHDEKDIQELLDVSKNSCNKGFYESMYNYTDISVSQVLDYQNLTVFLGIASGGYIPVTPSTSIDSLEKISINSAEFRLLYPNSQYESLMSIKESHPELTPVGITKILDSNIVTGIKLENGGIVPVSHSQWDDSPLDTVEDLFYIEKYSSPEEDFTTLDSKFLENLEKVKNLDSILDYIKEENYTNLIEVITPITNDVDEITRIIWFLINNQEA